MAPNTTDHDALREHRFETLVNAVVDYAIYMIDADGAIVTWNAGARRFKGYEADEIIGRPYATFFLPEDLEAGLPGRILATAAREGRFEGEGWRLRKDGTRFWAHAVVDAIRDESGALIGYAKITRDLTERRQAEEALKRAEEELEETRAALFQSQKMQALGELTGGIAHDFNNLLTVIRGSAELLQRPGLTDEKRRRYLASILETADRATSLTNHLLAFGRRQALKPEVLDLNLRLDAFADVIQRTLGSRIDVRLDLAPDLWPVEVDTTQLETALLNAAINARDAMPEGGSLTFATANRIDDNQVALDIADSGEGMSSEVLERVFEPFFTTKAVGKGTGLGLSQIHGFAAQTGGRAEIESEPGRGTRLRILFPRSGRRPGVAADREPPSRDHVGLRILLAEDNEQVRRFAESLLGELGCTVVAVGSGEEALAALAEERSFDLLFSDVIMPGISGVELATRVRARHPDLPVLLASGYSEELFRGAAAEFVLVAKPYSIEAVTRGLSRAVERASAQGGTPAPPPSSS
jgi:PAS domain S-box-containing protein